jgi:Transposase DDE domain
MDGKRTDGAAGGFPREQFVQEIIGQLPLADAALSLGAYVLQPEFLDTLFQKHRQRSYEDTLSFAGFVQVVSDSLLQHGGSARKCLERAEEAGTLPVSAEAFYGKLRRVPLELSQGFLAEASLRLQDLLPARPSPLPASLAGLEVTVIDGKKLKRVAKRLLPTRKTAGKLFGGKLLVAWRPSTGLAIAMAANLDGEANDCRLVPDLLPQVRALVPGPRLWVVDRQFCDLVQIGRFTQDHDHFVARYHPKVHFHADPQRPPHTSQDKRGRTVVEEWGWLGSARLVYVRRITLRRLGAEDIILVTDLLDGDVVAATDLLAVYLQRWGIERVFQQVTEVFHLQRLIGSTPQATVFQGAFCLLLYNVIQVLKGYIAVAEGRDPDTISSELLFYDIHRQLTAVTELANPAEIVRAIPSKLTRERMAARLRSLLKSVWTPRWRKAVNKHPRPQTAKVKGSGAHTSVHRVLEQHRHANGGER